MPIIKLDYTNTKIHDTYVTDATPTNSYGTGQVMNLGASDTVSKGSHGLIKFDLGLIPNGAVINSAVLNATKSTTTADTFEFRDILSDWDSNVTWNTRPSVGGVISSFTSPASVPFQADVKTFVEGWVSGSKANHGIYIINKSTVASGINSSEHSTVTNRPTLTIDYEIPTTKKKQVEHVATNSAVLPPSGTLTAKIALPAGVQKGDLLMALLTTNGATSLSANGWNLLSHEVYSGGNRYSVLTKQATGTETDIELSFSTNLGNGVITNHIFRNVKSVNGATEPLKVGTGTNTVPNPMTGIPPNSLILVLGGAGSSVVTVLPTIGMKDLSIFPADSRTLFAKGLYTHNKNSYTSAELTVAFSGSATWGVKTIALEPVTNEPPTIDGTNEHLGTRDTPLSKQYTVADAEGDAITIVERLDGVIHNTRNGVGTYTLDLASKWPGLSHGKHTVTITATDPEGRSEVRTWTFTKVLNMNDDTDTLIKGLLDTVPEIMKGKALLGKAIRDNGGSVLDTDALEVMAKAMLPIDTGVKTASGLQTTGTSTLVIRGLSFKPKIIAVRTVGASGHINFSAVYVDSELLGGLPSINYVFSSSQSLGTTTIYADGFSILAAANPPHNWVAFG